MICAQMEQHYPQLHLDGSRNVWIIKPGALSRGRGKKISIILHTIYSISFTIRNYVHGSFGTHPRVGFKYNCQERGEMGHTKVHRTSSAHL